MGRIFGFAGIMVAMAVALFFYSKQVQSVSGPAGDGGKSVVNVTGVKNDLIGIANAERAFFAEQARYAPLDELVSAKYLSTRTERPPYAYDFEITSQGFRVTATRSTSGSPAKLWIDETMQIQMSE
jgi:hypothetical protein